MKLSLVLTAHNKASYLGFMLEHLRRQIPEAEFVLVDDGSSDGTGEVMRPFADQFLRTEDVWETRANNAGLALAKGDYIAVLQDDDLPLAVDWLSVMTTAMEAHGIDILSGRPFGAWHFAAHPELGFERELRRIGADEAIGLQVAALASQPEASRIELVLQHRPFAGKEALTSGLYEAECVVRSPFVLTRRVWERCGPFDEIFAPLLFDDYDLCARARRAGFRVAFTHLPKRVRFGGGSHWLYEGGAREGFFAEIGQRNEATFLARHVESFPPFEEPPLRRLGEIRFALDQDLEIRLQAMDGPNTGIARTSERR